MMTKADRERAEIERQTAEFLANGGAITPVGNTLPEDKEFKMVDGRLRYRDQKRYKAQRRGGRASRVRKAEDARPKLKNPRAKVSEKPKQVEFAKPRKPAPQSPKKPIKPRRPDTGWTENPIFRGLKFGGGE